MKVADIIGAGVGIIVVALLACLALKYLVHIQ